MWEKLTLSQILYSYKLKEFLDDIFCCLLNGGNFFKRIKNMVGKGEIAHYAISSFPTVFSKELYCRHVKPGLVWEGVNKASDLTIKKEFEEDNYFLLMKEILFSRQNIVGERRKCLYVLGWDDSVCSLTQDYEDNSWIAQWLNNGIHAHVYLDPHLFML